jgi:Spy/CpxP family protein refolding chaperone
MRNAVCTLALTGLLAFGMAGSALAQENTPPNTTTPPQGAVAHGHQMDASRDMDHMTKHLKLTQDQQSQIQPIVQERDQQLNQLWQDSSMSKSDRRTKSQQIRDDSDSKINAILTDQQRQKYTSMEARHHHKRRVESSGGAQDTQPQ